MLRPVPFCDGIKKPSVPNISVEPLPPTSFAFVMATGIVSIRALQFRLAIVADALFAFNLAAYVAVACLTAYPAVTDDKPYFILISQRRY